MTTNNSISLDYHFNTVTGLFVDTIDAYDLAHEAISDMSVIFKALDKLTVLGLCDERLARILWRAGYQLASDRLKLIDEKIAEFTNELNELRQTAPSGKAV